MVYPVFPTSPPPADLTRKPFWNHTVSRYDSGKRQSSSPYRQPLYRYGFNLQNMAQSKQSSLEAFINDRKGGAPFLFSDPYHNRINGVVCVRTGTAARSFFVVTSEGYAYIPVSGNLLITSNLSGALTQGTHYQFDPETGVFSTWVAPASTDFWTASCQFFRKCGFNDYDFSSKLWQSWQGQVSFEEIALP